MKTINDVQEHYGQFTGKAVEAFGMWAEANQKIMRDLAEFSAGTAQEGVRLYAELQSAAVEAVKEGQSYWLRRQGERHAHRPAEPGEHAERRRGPPPVPADAPEEPDGEAQQQALRVPEHEDRRRWQNGEEPRGTHAGRPVARLRHRQPVEQHPGDEGGDLHDQHGSDAHVPEQRHGDHARRQRQQGEEPEAFLRDPVIAVVGDVAVERGVPREQPLVQLQRPRARRQLVGADVGDDEPDGDTDAGQQPSRNGSAQPLVPQQAPDHGFPTGPYW